MTSCPHVQEKQDSNDSENDNAYIIGSAANNGFLGHSLIECGLCFGCIRHGYVSLLC